MPELVSALSRHKCTVNIRRGPHPAKAEAARKWTRKYAEYARLAAIVYRNNKVGPAPGWTRTSETLDDAQSSLYFEIWEKPWEGGVQIAVVFRGTHELKDWWSNARWITRFIPTGWDQYDLTRRVIGGVVDRARQRHPDAEVQVVTVGHSLGGGLAQQAAYAQDSINQVYAFDPSPVSGFRSVPEPERTRNRQGILIDRVYERGEILAYLRKFLRRFIPLSEENPEITEIRFDLSKGESIQQHSMVDLALRMSEAAEKCPE